MTKKTITIDSVEAEEALAGAKLNGLKKKINANSWTKQTAEMTASSFHFVEEGDDADKGFVLTNDQVNGVL